MIHKIAWLDTETTGTDENVNDVIQVAILIDIGGRIVDEFKGVCRPHDFTTIEPRALEVNGLNIDQLRGFPPPKQLHDDIEKLFGKHVDKYDTGDKFTLAGMRTDFDAQFMKSFFMKCGDKWWGSWCNWRHLDLIAFARLLRWTGHLDIENDKLVTICNAIGVPLDNAHDAMADIKATRAAFIELVDRHIKFDIPAGGIALPGPFVMIGENLVREEDADRENKSAE